MQISIPARFSGPPGMGHGGYVAGLLAEELGGPLQVTLRRPTPLDTPLQLVDAPDGGLHLRNGDDLIAEAEPSTLELEVPAPPPLDEVAAAEPRSPSHLEGRGVHPTCFGCGRGREPGDGLRIFAGPVAGFGQVAAAWVPDAELAEPGGSVATRWVLAALDCPGAFAYLVDGTRAGLLGRIVFEQSGEVQPGVAHTVTGWQIGSEGRKHFAGTALFDSASNLLASARATWFEISALG